MKSVNRFTFIAASKEVSVDGEKYIIEIENVEPENLHAIQWYGMGESPWGEIEYTDENNSQFFDFALIRPIYDLWLKAKKKYDDEVAEINRLKDIEDNRYEKLRANDYPDISDQVASLMKMMQLVLAKGVIPHDETTKEFNELMLKISIVKGRYPKIKVEQEKSAKKKNK